MKYIYKYLVLFSIACNSETPNNGFISISPLNSNSELPTTENFTSDFLTESITFTSSTSDEILLSSSTEEIFSTSHSPDFGSSDGCKGKIDFLFSISAGANMKFAQEQLKASLPLFISTLENKFAEYDFHILVAGSLGWIPECSFCVDMCQDGPSDYPCDAAYNQCDWQEGAGITFPRGWNATNKRCELYGNRRYIIKNEPNLLDNFECIASVGTSGSYSIAEDAVLAISPKLLAGDGCNWQFLRDDALLVPIFISESDDDVSDGNAASWNASFLAAKNYDTESIVSLVITADNDNPMGSCKPVVNYKSRLREFSNLVKYSLFRSICVTNFDKYFDELADLINQQCTVFIPN